MAHDAPAPRRQLSTLHVVLLKGAIASLGCALMAVGAVLTLRPGAVDPVGPTLGIAGALMHTVKQVADRILD